MLIIYTCNTHLLEFNLHYETTGPAYFLIFFFNILSTTLSTIWTVQVKENTSAIGQLFRLMVTVGTNLD